MYSPSDENTFDQEIHIEVIDIEVSLDEFTLDEAQDCHGVDGPPMYRYNYYFYQGRWYPCEA